MPKILTISGVFSSFPARDNTANSRPGSHASEEDRIPGTGELLTLLSGTRLGPYEILSPLGAGGMGEVYRARDPRLGREVAIKVLPKEFASDPERIRRFEREARSASALSDPHIVTVYDVGDANGVHYFASELVDGSDLRQLLDRGALSTKRTLELAEAIATGLAAAHEKGIVHRDLKPENILLTKTGVAKIADFGLAKLAEPSGANLSEFPTSDGNQTSAGVIMGTVGYMSPEQASGRALDFRSDQFSFGTILYEMATGNRPFHKPTAAQTLTAIIQDDPEPIARSNPATPAALRWIAERCLAKDPEQRYASTRDLSHDLKSTRERISEVAGSGESSGPAPARTGRRRTVGSIALLATLAAGLLVGRVLWNTRSASLQFHRLTFRSGTVSSAMFTPDERTVVYSAAWQGRPAEIFSTRMESPESRSLGISDATLLGMSSASELAILLHPRGNIAEPGGSRGTLARVPLAGGAYHEVLEDVVLADWLPDGSDIAVVRKVGSQNRLELPIGHPLYETANNVLAIRLSPKGDRVALAEHAPGFGTNGLLSVVSRDGKKATLVDDEVGDFADLAWAPSGKEIWYEFGIAGSGSLKAVDLSGHRRTLLNLPGRMQLFDVARDGRALINKTNWRVSAFGAPAGESRERDFSWLDVSEVDDVSSDGRELLITDFGEGGDPRHWSIFLLKTDGSPAVRLGDGQAMALSPDGKSALALVRTVPPQLVAYPTGPGEPVRIPNNGVSDYFMAGFLPDGRHVLFAGVEPGHSQRCYIQSLDGGALRPVTPEGMSLPEIEPGAIVSPKGDSFIAIGPDHLARLYALEGQSSSIPGIAAWEMPVHWSSDGESLYVATPGSVSVRVDRVNLSTGARSLWREIAPPELAGVQALYAFQISPEHGWYFYSCWRVLSDLYVVEGLK